MRNTLLLVFLCCSLSLSGATYYISPAGSNSNNGSSGAPWLTLAYACSKTTSGDIIHVNAGTYNENSRCSLPVGVSIVGEGDASLIRTNYNAGEYNGTIRLASAKGNPVNGNQSISYIKIDGLSSPGTTAIDIEFRYNVSIHHVTITNCSSYGIWIFNNNRAYPLPPTITYATGNSVYGCAFINCEHRFEGQSGFEYYNNIHNNSSDIKCITSDWMKTFLIHDNVFTKVFSLTGWNFMFETWHFSDNSEIYNNIFNGNSSLDLSDIRKGNGTWGLKVHNNQFLRDAIGPQNDHECYIINVEGWGAIQYLYIYNNYFKNITSPISVGSYNQSNCVYPDGTHWALDHIYICYNIVENAGITNSDIPSLIWFWENSVSGYSLNQVYDNIYICNNTLTSTGDANRSQYGMYIKISRTATNFHINNNIIRGCLDNAIAIIYGSNFNTISVQKNLFYQNGYNTVYWGSTPTNKTENNLTPANPLFVSSTDFHLQSGSPAIGKGIPISGFTTDYAGNPVFNPPSIGALEYGSAPTSPVIPVYQSSVVEDATPSSLEMTYDQTLAMIVPTSLSFSVSVNSVARTVNAVTVSGTKVRLTLASAIKHGDIVTVSYTKPASNPLQTPPGGQASSISSKSVKNNCNPPVPTYLSSVVQNATPSIIEMTYSQGLTNIVPSGSAFTVQINAGAITVNGVNVSETNVQLTLASAVKFGDIVTVSYTKPATNPLQNATGGISTSISAQPTTNNLINPIKDATPVTITMTIYPNRVHKIINVLLVYSSSLSTQIAALSPEILKITNLSGTLFIEKLLVPGVTNIKIPLNLKSGIYMVRILANGMEMTSQKMRVY